MISFALQTPDKDNAGFIQMQVMQSGIVMASKRSP